MKPTLPTSLPDYSYLGTLKQLYHDIDLAINNHFNDFPDHKKTLPCKDGCSACCSQFFEISEGEALYILYYVSLQSIDFQQKAKESLDIAFSRFVHEFASFYQSHFKYSDTELFDYEAYFNDPIRFEIRIPCPFLSVQGSCTIYPARPIICRTTGSSYTTLDDCGEICEIIPSSLKSHQWQADLRHFQDRIWSFSELSLLDRDDSSNSPFDSDEIIELRQFPLFYSLYELLCLPASFEEAYLSPLFKDYLTLTRSELEKKLFHKLIL
jgi:Fe-S-cluster containining protein